jgi:voltage-gated potassium channel
MSRPGWPPTWPVSGRIRSNVATFVALMSALCGIVLLDSAIFHVLMLLEGQQHSWLTGVYWTLQTMSTLGYGDVVFRSDLGRLFSIVVLATGITVLFVFLPFTLIQFFYAPWLEARSAARAPRELPAETSQHVLLTAYGAIETALIDRLVQFRSPYVVVVPDAAQALALNDQGIRVMVGRLDDPETYRRARVDRASLVATTLSDATNANVALSVRSVSTTVPIVATAAWETSIELLKRAGCNQVVQLGEMLGRSMALRIAGQDGKSHVVGELDELLVAEAAAANTALVGHTLRELRLRERFSVTVAGVWGRGRYIIGTPDVEIRQDTVLLLSGTRAELDAYDRAVRVSRPAPTFALIVGGGRVGFATSHELAALGIDHRLIEMAPDRVRDRTHLVVGDATDPDVLHEAGIDRAAAVVVTTRDDDVNVYVTLHCRQLRPDIQILSRVTHERNVQTLYAAGADVVLSYFPMEANAIFGVLRRGNLLLLAEGLDLFTVQVPRRLVGQTLADARLRQTTGCNVLAVRPPHGTAQAADPEVPLAAGAQLLLIGDRESVRRATAMLGE